MGKLQIAVVCFCLIHAAGQAQIPDDIAKKISTAKNSYYADREKAEKLLLDALTRRESAAKKGGDLKTLEIVRLEIDAFRKEARLPKLVPTALFQTSMNTSFKKAEAVYLTAIKKYTQQDNIEAAKAVQQLYDEFSQTARYKLDWFQPKCVWVDEKGIRKMTILDRQAESFRAQDVFSLASEKEPRVRELVGSIKNDQVLILEKDVKFVSGTKFYKDTKGILSFDERGEKIDFSYINEGKIVSFIMRPQQ